MFIGDVAGVADSGFLLFVGGTYKVSTRERATRFATVPDAIAAEAAFFAQPTTTGVQKLCIEPL